MAATNVVNFCGGAPQFLDVSGGTAALMDASGEKVAMIVTVPKSGNIAGFTARIGTVTSAESLTGSVQALDTSGNPDGTPIQSGTVAVPSSNSYATFTFGSVYAATAGTHLAFVVEFTSAVGNLNVMTQTTQAVSNHYVDHFTASWAKLARGPWIAVEYDDGTTAHIVGTLAGSLVTENFASSSTPDEIALRMYFPGPVTISGAYMLLRVAAASTVQAVLYTGTTATETASLDGDVMQTNGAERLVYFGFGTPRALAANTEYRLAFKPDTATHRLGVVTVSDNDFLGQFDLGKDFYYSSRTDAGAWSDTTTKRPMIWPAFSQIDNGAGSGGGLLAHPGMRGGFV